MVIPNYGAVRAFAHRGWHMGHLAGQENTLAAFRYAVDQGFTHLETDVHVTADGVPVIMHDATLDRTTTMTGRVDQLPWRQVSAARVAGSEPVPTFEEVLRECPTAFFNIDPKSDADVVPLLTVVQQADAWNRVAFGSFSDRRLDVIRRLAPAQARISLGPLAALRLMSGAALPRLAAQNTRKAAASAWAAQLPLRFRGVPVITPRLVQHAHRRGLEVHAWTIDSPSEMARLLDMGVDGIITDRPDLLQRLLAAREQWH